MSVSRALPQAVRMEHPCLLRQKVRCLDLELADWRYGDLTGELYLESRQGRLMTITFRGVVKTRTEEDAIVHHLHEVYGMPETRGSAGGRFLRYVRGMTPETFCDYTAKEQIDGIHIDLEFDDRRYIVVREEVFLSPAESEAALRRQKRSEARHHRK